MAGSSPWMRATGRELWRVAPADPTAGEWLSAAPIVWQDRVYVGVAGSDFGIRGRMLAFNPATGALLWQFNMVPQPPEFGADTWPGDTWRTGGGGTWSTAALDPLTGRVVRTGGESGARYDPAAARPQEERSRSGFVHQFDRRPRCEERAASLVLPGDARRRTRPRPGGGADAVRTRRRTQGIRRRIEGRLSAGRRSEYS